MASLKFVNSKTVIPDTKSPSVPCYLCGDDWCKVPSLLEELVRIKSPYF